MNAALRDPFVVAALCWLGLVVIVTVIAPAIAPYQPFAMTQDAAGQLARLKPPSAQHWLGTTLLGYDVFSQLVLGTRTAFLVGLSAAVVSVALGLVVGLASGYYRGVTDSVLMRLTDVAYAIPFEPLAIVLLSVLSRSEVTMVLTIVFLFWRQSARVVRNQVLTSRQRPFIKSARLSGASHLYILTRHLLPLAANLAFVYMPVAFGNAILAEASIDFLGFGNPNIVSWGGMLRSAFTQGAIGNALWWSLSPGLCITVTTAAVYLASRPLEEWLDPRLRERTS